MEILNVGLGEMVFILIIALLVFGPERLPEIARQAGRVFAQVRGMSDELQRAIMTETQPLREPFEEAKREIESTAKPVKDVTAELNSTLRTANNARTTVARTVTAEATTTKGTLSPATAEATSVTTPDQVPPSEATNGNA